MAGVISASQKNSAVPSTPMAIGAARPAAGLADLLLDQCHQRQDAAFAGVVRAQQQQHVFQRDQDQQAPEDQRQHAEDFGRLARRRPPAALSDSLNAYSGLVPMSP